MAKKGNASKRRRIRGEAALKEAEARAREEESRITREVTGRALWRLNILEYVILFVAMVLALLGGALVAWILEAVSGLSFRVIWAVASLLLFVVPGGTVYLRELRRERGRCHTSTDEKAEGNTWLTKRD